MNSKVLRAGAAFFLCPVIVLGFFILNEGVGLGDELVWVFLLFVGLPGLLMAAGFFWLAR